MDDYEEIQKLEIELADPFVRKDINRLSLLIADDFKEFGSDGKSYNKDNILELLPDSESVSYQLSEFEFKNLAKDCVLVRYRSSSLDENTFRTSIWTKTAGNWQIVHHQSTIIPNVT